MEHDKGKVGAGEVGLVMMEEKNRKKIIKRKKKVVKIGKPENMVGSGGGLGVASCALFAGLSCFFCVRMVLMKLWTPSWWGINWKYHSLMCNCLDTIYLPLSVCQSSNPFSPFSLMLISSVFVSPTLSLEDEQVVAMDLLPHFAEKAKKKRRKKPSPL